MKVLCISDTHGKHDEIPSNWLEPADIIIHAGDISNVGRQHEIKNFCNWFSGLDQYKYKIFIAGNHDWGFQKNPIETTRLVRNFENLIYLEDSGVEIEGIKFYGSPWQPEFYNWAFNLPRNGVELAEKWNAIPDDTDVLITHGPAFGRLDVVYSNGRVGCELLAERLKSLKVKKLICGHIHDAYGESFNDWTHFINASTLSERYEVQNKPIIFEI